jgi:hypothetical protein
MLGAVRHGTTVLCVEGPILDLDNRLDAQPDPVLNWTWLLRHFR